MRPLLTAVLISLYAVAGLAQSDRGAITGTIADPTAAAVADAPIEATNTETGAVYQTASTSTGNYTLAQLPAGEYAISVSVPGFKKYERTGINVPVAQTLRVDISLEVGLSTESVTVQADAALLKTESGELSHNVTSDTLNQLPIMGPTAAAATIRNVNNILFLVTGAYYVPGSQVKINGAPSNSQAVHIEGQDATTQGFPYAPSQQAPSVDALQEVSVQTSNFAPEFGQVGGGFFNMTMKSGTNKYHGTVYDYYLNEAFNAGTPFTNAGLTDSRRDGQLVRPAARRNDYGVTLGGPVRIPKLYNGHDRTFFFFNFEQYRDNPRVNNLPITVPTPAYRSGDFSAAIASAGNKVLGTDVLGRPEIANEIYDPTTARMVNGQLVTDPFPNNQISPSRFDPVALNIQSAIPLPNLSGLFNNYLPSFAAPRHVTIPAVKIDENIGAKGKLSFYWSFTHIDNQFGTTLGAADGLPNDITAARGSFIHSHTERINYDHTLTPTLLLHLGIGYQQNNFFDDAPDLDFNAAATWGLKGATVIRNVPVFNGLCGPLPTNTCGAAGGMKTMGPSAGQSHSYWEKPSANASTTWVKDNHTYKLGGEMFLNGVPTIPYANTYGNYTFSPNETALPYTVGTVFAGGSLGFPYASFLLGAVDQFSIAAPAQYKIGKTQVGMFIQDAWRINRKLTVNYGLRWDWGGYYKEQYNRGLDFSASTPNPSVGGEPGAFIFEGSGPGHCNCSFVHNYPYAIGPRLGIAYQIAPKTVVRGGWGLVYGQTGINTTGVNNPAIAETNTVVSPGLGQPATYLSTGIPAQYVPQWPVYNPGIVPGLPTGNQPLPSPGVGGNSGIGFLDPQESRPPRQNQWSIGVEREITRDLVAEVSYVGNRGVWWGAPGLTNLNAITPQLLQHYGLDINNPADQALLLSTLSSSLAAQRGFNKIPYAGFSPSNTVAQALRPFPQFGTIPDYGPPLGKTWYDSLQAKATQRLTHGLVFNVAFTWQKSMQEGVDTNTVLNNILANFANSKSISSFEVPLTLVTAVRYTLPRLHTNRFLSALARDWEISTLLQYSSGLPIPTPPATTSIANQLFQSTLADRVPGQPLYTVDINCHCFDPAKTFVLNPAAWVNPPQGQFGTGAEYYDDFRYQRHPVETAGFGRLFRIKERYTLNIRMDFVNIFNRTYLNNPTATGFSLPQTQVNGQNTGGFGYINLATAGTQIGQPRNGTLVARFTF